MTFAIASSSTNKWNAFVVFIILYKGLRDRCQLLAAPHVAPGASKSGMQNNMQLVRRIVLSFLQIDENLLGFHCSSSSS